jgi:hypothetical protein
MSPRVALSVGVLLLAGFAGCIAEQLEPDVGALRAGVCTPADSDPMQEVSFKNDVLPLFERTPDKGPGCGCHLPASGRAIGLELTGLDLSTFAGTMRGGDNTSDMNVVPGDPCSSILLQKITGAPPFGARMPSNGPPFFSPREQMLLSDWIAEGAHDN